jgi:hypothetical protein
MLNVLEGLWVKKTDNQMFDDGWKLKFNKVKKCKFVVITEPNDLGGKQHKLCWVSNVKKLDNGRVGFDTTEDNSILSKIVVDTIIKDVNTGCSNVSKYVKFGSTSL